MNLPPTSPQRGYTIIADTHFVTRMTRPVDHDLCVRIMEYIRQHFRKWEPRLPVTCEFDLIAGPGPHSEGPVLLLGMHTPPGTAVPDGVEDFFHLYGVFEAWCDTVSDSDLRAFGGATEAPTWDALKQLWSWPVPPVR